MTNDENAQVAASSMKTNCMSILARLLLMVIALSVSGCRRHVATYQSMIVHSNQSLSSIDFGVQGGSLVYVVLRHGQSNNVPGYVEILSSTYPDGNRLKSGRVILPAGRSVDLRYFDNGLEYRDTNCVMFELSATPDEMMKFIDSRPEHYNLENLERYLKRSLRRKDVTKIR